MRERHRFEPRVRAERTKNLPYVVSDGLSAEMEGRCDLVGGRALTEQLEDLVLAFREMDGARSTRRPDYRDAEDRLIRLAAFDDYRADLGATAPSVDGEQIDRVIGDGYAEEQSLQLALGDRLVFWSDDRHERPAD